MFALVLLLILNFAISWANASSCGRYWSESKITGGFFRFNVIIGYIMAIAGFTMVYGSILLLLLPYIVPLIPQLQDIDLTLLMQLTSDLLYVLIAGTVIPTGFVIWFQSLATFWKRKTLGNFATAGYNTYAQIRNTISAYREMPSAIERIAESLFGGSRKSKKKSDSTLILVAIFVIILALLSGYFTASSIMKKADRKHELF